MKNRSDDKDETPRWIPIVFGFVMFVMGAMILGAISGLLPTDGGVFLAPIPVVLALGLCLIVGALVFWLPASSPAVLRGLIFTAALLLLAVVCNWTAFAPGVFYSSSTSIGPISIQGEDSIGGRIVFGIAALIVDAILIAGFYSWIRSKLMRDT